MSTPEAGRIAPAQGIQPGSTARTEVQFQVPFSRQCRPRVLAPSEQRLRSMREHHQPRMGPADLVQTAIRRMIISWIPVTAGACLPIQPGSRVAIVVTVQFGGLRLSTYCLMVQ